MIEPLSFDVQYTVKSVIFDCMACGKELTITRGSRTSIGSGIHCQCAGCRYYIDWDTMLLRFMGFTEVREMSDE